MPSRVRRALAIFALPILCLPALADTVTVFAAASLREALADAVGPFETATGHKVAVSYAASNVLARQIEAGAPAALFISADVEWVDYVERQGFAIPGTRRALLGNELVLIAPAASAVKLRIARGIDLRSALGEGRLAVADPRAVPAGKYARAALQSVEAWEPVASRLAPAESVRAALAMVARGEAPLGIVYRTDAMAEPRVRVVDGFPSTSHPPIVYPLVIVKGAGIPAREFAAYLAAPGTRATWERYGFRRLP